MKNWCRHISSSLQWKHSTLKTIGSDIRRKKVKWKTETIIRNHKINNINKMICNYFSFKIRFAIKNILFKWTIIIAHTYTKPFLCEIFRIFLLMFATESWPILHAFFSYIFMKKEQLINLNYFVNWEMLPNTCATCLSIK